MSEKPLTTDEVETIIARNLDVMGIPRPMTRQEALLQCGRLLDRMVLLESLLRDVADRHVLPPAVQDRISEVLS